MKPSNRLFINSLDAEWCDKNSVLLHACFQLLKDFVEKEDVQGYTDWSSDESLRKAKKEIDELYHWWLNYCESEVDTEESFELENAMLIRLVTVRWAMWS